MRRYRKQLFTLRTLIFELKILLSKFSLLKFGILELFFAIFESECKLYLLFMRQKTTYLCVFSITVQSAQRERIKFYKSFSVIFSFFPRISSKKESCRPKQDSYIKVIHTRTRTYQTMIPPNKTLPCESYATAD